MKFGLGVLSSWFFVVLVYLATLHFDGLSIFTAKLDKIGVVILLVAVFSAIYFAVMGLPILYIFSKREKISRFALIVSGFVASIPMLVLCLVSREIEWVVGTCIAGVGAGWVFTLVVPSESFT